MAGMMLSIGDDRRGSGRFCEEVLMIDAIGGSESIAALLAKLTAHNQPSADPFSEADVDGGGTLDKAEVQSFLDVLTEKAGVTVSADEFIAKVDGNGDGTIDSDEFSAGRDYVQRLLGMPEPAGDPFAKADTDGNGSLNETELQTFLQTIGGESGQTVEPATTSKVFAALDTNKDGVVDAGELAAGRERTMELLGLLENQKSSTTADKAIDEAQSSWLKAFLGNYDGGTTVSALLSTLA